MMNDSRPSVVIFGLSNILSDLFDAVLAAGMRPARVVIHEPEQPGERDLPVAGRLAALAPLCQPPELIRLDEFSPVAGEHYLIGPTTPMRSRLVEIVKQRWGLAFDCLIHPTAYVSPLAQLGEGVFVGANSVIAPGVQLAEHVFINRGVTIGHDTCIGAFSRVQPGANLGGLSRIGRGVTVGLGASVLERLVVGDEAVIGGGAVVLLDVPERALVVGVPAKIKKYLDVPA